MCKTEQTKLDVPLSTYRKFFLPNLPVVEENKELVTKNSSTHESVPALFGIASFRTPLGQ
jgi:hypothetical protein